jgi:uncharacterized delta-60 repeat protein
VAFDGLDQIETANRIIIHEHVRALFVLAVEIFVSAAAVLVSYAQSGSLDVTFNPGSGADATVFCAALQTNSQVIIGGSFNSIGGTYCGRVARLNMEGGLDSSFGPVAPDGAVYASVLQPDGTILIGGNFGHVNGVARSFVARLRPDGSVDTSFGDVGPGGSVHAIVQQVDGKLLIGGDYGVSRLNTNGTLDATFNSGLRTYFSVSSLGLQSDGSIVVGGAFNSIGGTSRNGLARLNANGSVDTNFDAAMSGVGVSCLLVTPQDKIIVGGNFTGFNGYFRINVARLNADGSVDTMFSPGQGPDFNVTAAALQSDGKVIICGPISGGYTLNNHITRMNRDGTVDSTFISNEVANAAINCLAIQGDGNIIIGGNFTQFAGTNINRIARLKGDTSPTTVLQFMAADRYFGTYLYGTVSNTYRVERTSKPNAPALWTPLFDVTLQTNPQFILDPTPIVGQRYYRAVALP